MKDFDLNQALSGARTVTRSGKEVTDLTYMGNADGEFKLVGTVDGEIHVWTTGGIACSETDIYDLYIEIELCEGWVNVYRDPKTNQPMFGNKVYRNVTDAEDNGKCSVNAYICTTLIEWVN